MCARARTRDVDFARFRDFLARLCNVRDNGNLLFCFAGSAHQDRSAGGHQGHGRHGGKYSVSRWLSARVNCFLATWIRLPTTPQQRRRQWRSAVSPGCSRSKIATRFVSEVQKELRRSATRNGVRSEFRRRPAGGKRFVSIPENKRNTRAAARPDRRLISLISERRRRLCAVPARDT